ncbi:interleukin-1 beta-like [Discoglossus pictus]
MAEVPEMNSILMHDYSEKDEEFYQDCSCEMKNSLDFHWNSCSKSCLTCKSGITLDITEQRDSPISFKSTVVLVVAVEKLKKGTKNGNIFSDLDLLDLWNDIFVEEEILYNKYESTFASGTSYRYFTSENYRIKDSSSKCLALQDFPRDAKLVALQLQGVNIGREEKISMAYYSTRGITAAKKQPVALGIMGRNLYLSCASAGGTPELRLEEVSNIQSIKNADLERFIFLKSENSPNSFSKTSFESAAFPGWYISTSQKENDLVRMAPQEDQRCIKEFSLFK